MKRLTSMQTAGMAAAARSYARPWSASHVRSVLGSPNVFGITVNQLTCKHRRLRSRST